MTADWLVLLVYTGLATYRLTRLVVEDDFPPIRWLRELVVGADGHRHAGTRYEWFGELVSCHWCASGWVALGATGVATLVEDAQLATWALLWTATWAVGAVLADRLG